MSDLRSFTLWARALLTKESGDLLQQVHRLDAETGERLPIPKGHILETSTEAQGVRQRIEKLLRDEIDAGLTREEAVGKLIKETAFTHLNRFVAFKLMEATGLIRSPLARRHEANGFKMWLAGHPADLKLYDDGDSPNDRDGFGEAPRDRAYRHFLLWQCGELTKEIKVLFDPETLPSLLFPRPGVLKELIDALNVDDRKEDWAAGNEETVGWVYQYFNAEEKAAAFDRVFKKKKKFEKSDLPAATQVFTQRWVVRFLVENSLGRLWLSMHPDSQLSEKLAYLVPLPAEPPSVPAKPVKEIRILDPATGTMHFGLVAFELLAEMYREELAHAGEAGWPAQASVQSEMQIPGMILANNLFGIDIDLRAVQLAALALYLKAKATHKQSILTESNLACADVAVFRGQHLNKIISEMSLPRDFTRELFLKFRDSLDEASMMGSLVRLDKHFKYFQSEPLRRSIDAYVEKKRAEGVDESYFANETTKGLRLLNVLERRYDIVFTNPPYMSNRNMNPAMSEFMKRNYKKSKGDLYAAFVERCVELLDPQGRLAMITQQSFMFISSFEDLRELLLSTTALELMAHLGPRAFAEIKGEKVNTTAFVLRREEQFEIDQREARGVYFRLVKEPDAESKRTAFEQALTRRCADQTDSRVYEYRQGDFAAIPGSPWVYWITPKLRNLFLKHRNFGQIAPVVHGTATYDNFRFTRYWFELGKNRLEFGLSKWTDLEERVGRLWVPVVKTGGTKWKTNELFALSLRSGASELSTFLESKRDSIRGTECMFRVGLSTGLLSSKSFKARFKPQGFAFDVSTPTSFPEPWAPYLGILNSSLSSYVLRLLNPTINFPPGSIEKIPIPESGRWIKLSGLVESAVSLASVDSGEDETSYDFIEPPSWPDGVEGVKGRHRDLAALEKEIDEEVYGLYEISPEDRKSIQEELAAPPASDNETEEEIAESGEEAANGEETSLTVEELAQRWISYAVGVALGRFARAGLENLTSGDGLMVVHPDDPDDLAQRVINILAAVHSDTEAVRVVRTAIGGNGDLRATLASYLLGPFFKAHVKRYRKRPVYWLLQSPMQNFSVYLFHERATDQTLALLQGKRYLGGRLFQLKEQLDQAKRKELTTQGKEKAGWKRKVLEAAEELSDLEGFQKAIDATNAEPIINAHGQPATTRWVPELDDGVLLNAAPLQRLMPAWKKADTKLDLSKAWNSLKSGEYSWAKTAMRYFPRETLAACKKDKSYRIAHGLE